jgi:hypothetical protein
MAAASRHGNKATGQVSSASGYGAKPAGWATPMGYKTAQPGSRALAARALNVSSSFKGEAWRVHLQQQANGSALTRLHQADVAVAFQ